MLKNFSFVKATLLTEAKAKALKGFKEAVEEVKLAKEGKLKTSSLNSFLDELPNWNHILFQEKSKMIN